MTGISSTTPARRTAALALACSLPLLLAACGGGGGSSTADSGSLTVALSDAPSCGYDAVYVTVTGVAVHQSASAGTSDSGWQTLTLAMPLRVNLLDLSNGVFATLGQLSLPSGTYQQVRLILADNSSNALANSVIPTGSSETALSTPSAMQTGLKINTQLSVPAGGSADLLLDFDACQSVVKRGNSGQYNLKPVLQAITDITLASPGEKVSGYVDSTLYSNARIALEQDGNVVRATGPDTLGQFVIGPVPAGSYDLVITSEGRTTQVLTGVPVTDTAPTVVNSNVQPIVPPVSLTDVAYGTVLYTTGSTIPVGHTAVFQTLTGGPGIQVGAQPTDATTGTYSYTLPTSTPQRAAYSAGATGYVFADDAVGPNFTMMARVDGTDQSQAFTLPGGGSALDFLFTAP